MILSFRFWQGSRLKCKTPWRPSRSSLHDNPPTIRLHQEPDPLQHQTHKKDHSQVGIRFRTHHFQQHNAKTFNHQEKYFQLQYPKAPLGIQTPFRQLWRHLGDRSTGSPAFTPTTGHGNQWNRRRIFLHHHPQTGCQSGSVHGQTGNFWHAEILFYSQQKFAAEFANSSRTTRSSL